MDQIVFIDMMWLQVYGLNEENILEYFSISPFYDKESNNQILRNQGIFGNKAYEQLNEMIGLEFNVSSSAAATKNPRLFVINKGTRINSREFEITEIFYCLDGSIFQTPTFTSLLRSRISKASNKLVSSHHRIHSLFEFSEEEVEDKSSSDQRVDPPNSIMSMALPLPSMKNTFSQLSYLANSNT